jgi:trk system potassium uptake protein TrkH
MLYKEVFKIIGKYLIGFSFTLLVPILYALYEGSDHLVRNVLAFLVTFLICFALGYSLSKLKTSTQSSLYRREGLTAVVLIWFITPAIACLPFLFTGTLKNPTQAYFESVSGLTTTGATILTAKNFDSDGKEIPYQETVRGYVDTTYTFYGNVDPLRNESGQIVAEGIEAVDKPLLFWRGFIQWLGGVGIIVLFVAVLPALGVGGKVLFQAEVPGPIKESLKPRIKETATFLWKIYVGFTLIQIVLLMLTNGKIDLFNAIMVAFGTISTGGFSVKNANIASYDSAYTDWIVILFMLLGSINFSLYYYILNRKLFRLFDPELIVYLSMIVCFSLYTSWMLIGAPKELLNGEAGNFTVSEALRHGTFQLVSAQSSTGFFTANYDLWPYMVQVLLLIAMYLGGMSGSTSGGIKTMRIILLYKIVKEKLETLYRPGLIKQLRIKDMRVDESVSTTVLCFFVTFIALSVLGTFILCMDGIDPETALTAISSCINNAGLAFRQAGPYGTFAFMSNFSLNVCSLWMILGRLEFFAVLVMLVPSFWKQNL